MTVYRAWVGKDFTSNWNPSKKKAFRLTLRRGSSQDSVAGHGMSPSGSFRISNGSYSYLAPEITIEFDMVYDDGGIRPTEHFVGLTSEYGGSMDATITVAFPDSVDLGDGATVEDYQNYEATVTLD
ncbi:hypothetical protein GALMADRAFT_917795 [Galerina marginata CBS 339.88]|uniref:Uncharacterized protein n=1 Tax=Galerina marginata (strain CBS 339.88) TaxID=685588 RepID=A0A067SPM0_GALM3|nr:hypothetical protein GALMADRAFT_917795 [Galerina marginata CBS 339.88]